MGCGWPCPCGSSDCGTICRNNLRDLNVDNFDFLTSWSNTGSGTVGTPSIAVSNSGSDLVFRLTWSTISASWSSANPYPSSFARIIALDKQVFSVADYGLPWARRDFWKYHGWGTNHWIVNGTDYIDRRYYWSQYSYYPSEVVTGTRYVGSPCVYAVFECNGTLFHCVGIGTYEEIDGPGGTGTGYEGRPWIPAHRSGESKHCLVTRRGYDLDWSSSVGFYENSGSSPYGSASLPGLPYQSISFGSPGSTTHNRDLPQWMIDYGYRMGFALSWQLGGQPITPKTTSSGGGGTVITNWTNQTIDADVLVKVKVWSPDIVTATPSVNCFENPTDFPNWYRFSLTVDSDVRNAFFALSDSECPDSFRVYDFPETTFVAADELIKMNGISGYIGGTPSSAQKHGVTVRVDNKVCESDANHATSMGSPPPVQNLNGATSYDGKYMGIYKILFREVCNSGETAVGCMIFTYFLSSITSGPVYHFEEGPVFYSSGLDASDGTVNVLSLYDANWTVQLDNDESGYFTGWANCLTPEQQAGITATISFHSSSPGTS